MLKLRLLLSILVPLAGCGGPRSTSLTWNSPSDAANKSMEKYDANHDGQLSADEIQECPAFSENLSRLDTNRDHKLSTDEIRARFDEHARLAKSIALETSVTSRGRPIAGAVVTLTPEPFMGPDFPTYTGTVKQDGSCPLSSEESNVLGVPVGFYTLKIVNGGKETVRGVEIAEDTTGSRLEIAL